MAFIASETGWTFHQILWEHTEGQIAMFMYGKDRLYEEIIDKVERNKGEGKIKRLHFKSPKDRDEHNKRVAMKWCGR
jgi:hypothetical protein